MKSYLTLLLLIIISSGLFAQCVSVELSVYWRKGEDVFFSKNDTMCQPYMNIIYRNNSDTPLYFLKVSHSNKELPQIPRGSMMRAESSYEKAKNYVNCTGKKYFVEFGASPFYLNSWEIFPDTVDIINEHELDIINDDLADIYEYIFHKICPNQSINKEKKLHYKTSDITQDNILNALNNRFVFLKAGDTYIDTYNLIGFQTVGGNFNFRIKQNCLKNYVYTESVFYKEQAKYVETKTYLPDKVGKYKLYYGDFYSNEITVKFSSESGE